MSLQEQLLDQANRLHREGGGGGDESGIDIDAQLALSRATSRRARRNSRLALIAQRRDVVAEEAGVGIGGEQEIEQAAFAEPREIGEMRRVLIGVDVAVGIEPSGDMVPVAGDE